MKARHSLILLVDDDPNDVVLVQRAFRRAQLDVSINAVPNVPQARAYLAGLGTFADRAAFPLPALVLLDLKLPGEDGIALLRWMSAQRELQRIPRIVLSSSREQGDVDGAYDAGASSYLVKPVAFEALQTMLTSFAHYWLNFNTPASLANPAQAVATEPRG